MIKSEIPTTPSRLSPARKTTANSPPTSPTFEPSQPKARTPSNRCSTYKQCVEHDKTARRRAISLVKQSDQYILEMDHQKREEMLEAAAQEVDAQRIHEGKHVSCLFQEAKGIEKTSLSPEEAAEKWETTKREIAAKVCGVRGKPKPEVRMVPKKMALSEEKASL